MTRKSKTARKGFTLVELAIVLAVAGLLFTGLWRLLATGNQQLKDSSAASQQSQLVAAVKNFLASPGGQTYMTGASYATGTTIALPLPLAADPAGQTSCYSAGDTSLSGTALGSGPTSGAAQWCSALPSGFSQATANSYGQTFAIQIRIESNNGPSTPPVTYSFLIVSQGGSSIADTSGGRISSQIGGDGGFIYTTNTCGLGAGGNSLACGAYGAWSADPLTSATGYGFSAGNAVSGHVASRSYISPDQASGAPWLARQAMQGDVNHGFNTMSTSLFMGTGAATNDLYLNTSGVGAAAQNILYGSQDGGVVGGTAYGGTLAGLNEMYAGMNAGDTNPAVRLIDNNNCIAVSFDGTNLKDSGGKICHAALQINGNQVTAGMVEADVLWAGSFIYGATSDIRMKRNIEPLPNALNDVMKLKPVTFVYKQNNKEDIGFIAQDLQKIYPQIVMGRPDGVLGVNYNGLLAPLVSSVQELKHQNDELRQQLKMQQEEIKQLETDRSAEH